MEIIGFSHTYQVIIETYHYSSPFEEKEAFFNFLSTLIQIQRHLRIQNLLQTMCIVLILVESCAATLDLSNLDVNDFQFFRYQQRLPNGELQSVPPPSSLTIKNHFQRAKAGKFRFQMHLCLTFTND